MIREQSARLADAMNDFNKLVLLLKELAERFGIGCFINRRKKKPNTADQLINRYQYSLS